MAKYAPPEVTEVWWVTTVANAAAPTATELNAGVDLTSFVRNMPDLPRNANLIDTATLASKYETREVGTRGGELLSMEILRDNATDTAYTTLAEDTVGFLAIARQGLATAGTWAVSDKVDLYPATVASLTDGTPGRNDPDTATAQLVATSAPNRNYTIV